MSGYFRSRLNTATARARSQLVRIIGPEFVWETTFAVSGTIAFGAAGNDSRPPELDREQVDWEPGTRRPRARKACKLFGGARSQARRLQEVPGS